MFLSFPVLLATTGAFLSWMIESEKTNGTLTHWGLTFESIVFYVASLLIVAYILVLGDFLRSYWRDDLRGRIRSCAALALTVTWLLSVAFNTVASYCYRGMPEPIQYQYHTLIARLLLTGSASIEIGGVFGASLRSWAQQRIASWFERNVPRMFTVQRLVSPRRKPLRLERLDYAMISLAFLAYGYLVLNTITTQYGTNWRGVLVGDVLFHAVFLATLVVLTAAALLRGRLNAIMGI
jgi:hypothetical protein